MKRSDIGGISVKIGRYVLEVVTVYHLPRVLALSKGVKTLWRLEV